MHPSSLNDTFRTISVRNSVVAGMSLSTIVEAQTLSNVQGAIGCVELVKTVSPWMTDTPSAPHSILKQPAGINFRRCGEEVLQKKSQREKKFWAGSPVVYSAQYMNEDQWFAAVQGLAGYLAIEFNLCPEDACLEAAQRLAAYAFPIVEFQSEVFRVPAYGAAPPSRSTTPVEISNKASNC